MIIINGKINGKIIINGRVIGEGGTGKNQEFNRMHSEAAENVEKITINSTFVDVNILASDSSIVETHFYGKACIDGELDFDVQLVNRELKISLKCIGNCYDNNLKIDVSLPRKTFKAISVTTSSANIILDENIFTKQITIKTQSGELVSSATFTDAHFSTMSGDVELCINPIEDIMVNITTMSGDVLACLDNVGHVKLSSTTMSGNVRNLYKGNCGYTADMNIRTMSGDINIK